MLERLQNKIMGFVKLYGKNAGFLPAFGLYAIENKNIPGSTMYDRATVALASVKGNYAHRVCRYDSRMLEKMEEDHLLLSEVQRALNNDEFTFYSASGKQRLNCQPGPSYLGECLYQAAKLDRQRKKAGSRIRQCLKGGHLHD